MIRRTLGERLLELSRDYPVVFLTGPRQSGKTTLTRMTFPDFVYVSLEDLQNRSEAQGDPRGFLGRFAGSPGVILDEVQRAPDLFSYLQVVVDEERSGPYVLTGSQHFLLSDNISQSLAGRAAILELLPFSIAELAGRPGRTPESLLESDAVQPKTYARGLFETLFTGFFPRIHDRRLEPTTWLDGYVRTYVERDVRSVANVGDLDSFSRFLGLCAGRSGQLLNLSSLGSDAGVSHVTAKRWVSILRTSYVVDLIQPHFANYSKRLVKTPKLYFVDPGLLCYLLGIRRPEDVWNHPLRGAIFETLVFAELRKLFTNHGHKPALFFFRDTHRHEVDVIVDFGNQVLPIEIKSGETIPSDALNGLEYYRKLGGDTFGLLVYGGTTSYQHKNHQIRSWFDLT